MIKTYQEFLNEIYVFRGGSESSSDFYNFATFYTTNKKAAIDYAKKIHHNSNFFEKEINFKHPLILLKKNIDLKNKLIKILNKSISDEYIENFPYFLDDIDRVKIINYARANKYDGIIMNDTDYDVKKIIKTYITI